jgi:CRISPR-associated exonuclease Cas4
MCLEEMLNTAVPGGALFYGRTRRRTDVVFDNTLRQETESVAEKARVLIMNGNTPPPVYEKRCESCSLIKECLPKSMGRGLSVRRYLKRMTEMGEQ